MKRLSLSDVQQGSRKLPSRLVIHGQAKVGKTSMAAYCDKPIFVISPGETGLHTLIDSGIVPNIPNIEIPDFDSLMQFIGELTTTEHSYKNVVFDTLDGFEKEANRKHCTEFYKGDWSESGFLGYQRGFRSVASGPWRELLAALDRLRETKRVGIILLAHTGVANQRRPIGTDFHRYTPAMAKEAWELTFGWSDICLFAEPVVVATKEKGDRVPKGHGGNTRVLHTEWEAAFDAGNRHGLPSEIDMGGNGKEAWDNFLSAVKSSRQIVKQEKTP